MMTPLDPVRPDPRDADLRFGRNHPSLLRRALPKTLFGRTMLIFLSAIILAQGVAIWIFYDRHWDTITDRLSQSIGGEMALVLDLAEQAPDNASVQALFNQAGNTVGLTFTLLPEERLPPDTPSVPLFDLFMINKLDIALSRGLGRPFQIDPRPGESWFRVLVATHSGVVEVIVPRKRLFSVTTHIFLLWMIGSALVLVVLALVFMRNQIKPIRRLAAAAERFGLGRNGTGDLVKAEGANEVRLAAMAFRRMQDRLSRQLSQRTALLAGISHDLRTPLTRLRLQLALMDPSADQADMLRDLEEMEGLIKVYLDFARGEGNEEPAQTDLAALLRRLAGDARRGGATVTVQAPSRLGVVLRADAMARCLNNLISNAAKHGQQVWLRAKAEPGGGGVRVLVEDDGPGIPAEKREAVFQPFVRLEAAPATGQTSAEGVGLGMTIARDIIFSHGGEIALEDRPGGGLRVVIRLPQ